MIKVSIFSSIKRSLHFFSCDLSSHLFCHFFFFDGFPCRLFAAYKRRVLGVAQYVSYLERHPDMPPKYAKFVGLITGQG